MCRTHGSPGQRRLEGHSDVDELEVARRGTRRGSKFARWFVRVVVRMVRALSSRGEPGRWCVHRARRGGLVDEPKQSPEARSRARTPKASAEDRISARGARPRSWEGAVAGGHGRGRRLRRRSPGTSPRSAGSRTGRDVHIRRVGEGMNSSAPRSPCGLGGTAEFSRPLQEAAAKPQVNRRGALGSGAARRIGPVRGVTPQARIALAL